MDVEFMYKRFLAMDPDLIPEKMRYLRMKRGLSREELAEKLGVSETTVKHMETKSKTSHVHHNTIFLALLMLGWEPCNVDTGKVMVDANDLYSQAKNTSPQLLADTFRTVRKQRHMTRSEMADCLDISFRSVGELERPHEIAQKKPLTRFALLMLLGVTPDGKPIDIYREGENNEAC